MSFARSLKPQAVTLEQETFEEAVRRYQLTEAQLQHRMNSYYRVAILCAILAVAALTWMVFLFVKAMIFPGIAALSLALLMFAYSFSEHFRYFLIRERRLGCTMSEWFFSLFGRKRSNTHE
ncbi:MAG: hypothetical protein A3I77_05610 [Gammaproteobacteria bacterium RIFCSPLOWO2_02_FULL_42_14]|nr:MAG: hypothetical protein A3I77_05610 [Gammaproteobacteria bacterium RIFCSPLOWO2_02_FULL_42_14]